MNYLSISLPLQTPTSFQAVQISGINGHHKMMVATKDSWITCEFLFHVENVSDSMDSMEKWMKI